MFNVILGNIWSETTGYWYCAIHFFGKKANIIYLSKNFFANNVVLIEVGTGVYSSFLALFNKHILQKIRSWMSRPFNFKIHFNAFQQYICLHHKTKTWKKKRLKKGQFCFKDPVGSNVLFTTLKNLSFLTKKVMTEMMLWGDIHTFNECSLLSFL